MAISLKNAEAVMNSLRGLNGVALFQAMKESGGYLFQKHVSKQTALEAARADHETKGYFKKLVKKQVENLAQYRELTPRQVKHITGLSVAKPQAKHFGKNKDISSTTTVQLSQADYSDLLVRAVSTTGGRLYQAGVNPAERFLYVINVPAGYVGRSVDEHENKSKSFDYLVLIVVAPVGGSPFLLNMFPAEAGYLGNKTALV